MSVRGSAVLFRFLHFSLSLIPNKSTTTTHIALLGLPGRVSEWMNEWLLLYKDKMHI